MLGPPPALKLTGCSVRVLRASVRPFLSSFFNFFSPNFPNLGAKIAKSKAHAARRCERVEWSLVLNPGGVCIYRMRFTRSDI